MGNKPPELRSQRQNANRHTQRGAGMLENTVQTDGWIGAITTAADGEVFDGSLRLDTAFPALNAEPIYVDTDGTRPVVVRRTDIKTADDPRAKRLSVAANRIAEVSLDWDGEVLEEWDTAIGLDNFWLEDEPKPWDAESSKPDGGKPGKPPKSINCECPECGHMFIREC